ncbi:hypothetical protein MHO82_07305 [Vibrio sp. Of7-15]|uniref:hypothetical protein n=1 Tax=Vibrio sp. Of7-15 TaxID=2724879 RepID=UPI001EF298E6|nr:hypothetical protein [Vibrio sp. Of7-15]MCG7496665.1 hypothetical protein [Vibrio sp. Of7-15]
MKLRPSIALLLITPLSLSGLTGCNGGSNTANNSNSSDNSKYLSSFNIISIENDDSYIKRLKVSWETAASHSSINGITYKLCKKETAQPDNCLELTRVINKTSVSIEIKDLLSAITNEYFILASKEDEKQLSAEKIISSDVISKMVSYIKASTLDAGDLFDSQVALPSNGKTLAVTACREGSNTTGINGDQSNNSAKDAGAVYIY